MSINISKKTLIKILILLSITVVIYRLIEKTITYQEEVKLSNGEMIWVDIKRHYWLSGGALGDVGSFTGNYIPSTLEISWDTGFEGVGRRSLSLNHVSAIDKIENVWYVIGGITQCSLDGSSATGIDTKLGIFMDGKCIEHIGSWIDEQTDIGRARFYVFAMNSDGVFDKKLSENLPASVRYNVLGFFYDDALVLQGSKLPWQQKLQIFQQERKGRSLFLTPIINQQSEQE